MTPHPTKKFYQKKTFKVLFQMVLTLIIFFAEAITGYYTNCMALISDSFHTLSDVISLCIGLAAIRAANKTVGAYSRKTFGNNRAEVLGGIIQAVFLYALCFNIYIEALKRFITPEKQSDVHLILVVGGIGLVVNLMGMWLFSGEHGHSHGGHGHSHGGGGHGHSHSDADEDDTLVPAASHRPSTLPTPTAATPMMSNFSLVENGDIVDNTVTKPQGNMNTRGIYLHIMGDTLGSVAVMASAGCLYFFQVPMTQLVPEGEYVPTTDFDEYCKPVANTTSQNLITPNTNCLILPDYDSHTWLYYVDPFLTFLIATIITCSTWPLFRESTRILMEHCPEDVNLEEFQKNLEKAVKKQAKCDTTVEITKNRGSTTTTLGSNNNQVQISNSVEQEPTDKSHKAVVHDLHIWSVSPQARAATVHIVIEKCCGEPDDDSISKYIDLVSVLKSEFKKIDVTSLTIQPEFISPVSEKNCQNCDCDDEDDTGGNRTTVDIEDIGRPKNSKARTVGRKRSTNKPPKDVNFYP